MERAGAVLLFVPFIVGTVWVFAVVIRRLLGVRVGWVRTLLAGLLALLTTPPVLVALAPPDPASVSGGEAFLLGATAIVISALLAMAALVILEVLLPTGSLPGPVEMWRGGRPRVARPPPGTTIVRRAGPPRRGGLRRGGPGPGPPTAPA
ncbi:AarF/ABC1/UbiB kinase family protein, partial [Paractinoplanes globisporus]